MVKGNVSLTADRRVRKDTCSPGDSAFERFNLVSLFLRGPATSSTVDRTYICHAHVRSSYTARACTGDASTHASGKAVSESDIALRDGPTSLQT